MIIRVLKDSELDILFHYSALEDWYLEEVHTNALFLAHQNDFFVAYEKTQLIGFVLAIKYNKNFGFISNVLVLQEFRSRGYGKEIFEHALMHLKGCQIALDSVKTKELFYEKYGFKSYFDVTTFKYVVGSFSLPKTDILLSDFNEKLHGTYKDIYMHHMLLSKKVHYKFVKDAQEPSFALCFKYIDGYKIAIESSNINEALTLFFALTQELATPTPIYIQASQLTPIIIQLTTYLKMQIFHQDIRMYNKILD